MLGQAGCLILSILRNLINSDKLQTHGLSIHAAYFRLLKMGAGFIYVRRRHMVNYHFQDKFYIKCMQNDYIMSVIFAIIEALRRDTLRIRGYAIL